MRAVTIEAGELTWSEHADPKLGDFDLLVSVRAAGVNSSDLAQRQGFYPVPARFPQDIPGLELAGEVVDLGARASRFSIGDRVMAVVGGGAQAELVAVDERMAIPVPPDVGWEEAGAFPEAFSTAYDALFTQCASSIGDRVLVTGAAGGVGTAAVQLANATGGLVTASVRRSELRDAVRSLGARVVLGPEEVVENGPYDVVLELVAGPGFARSLGALAVGGRMAVIGVGAGPQVEVDLRSLMLTRGRISASTLRARPLVDKALVARSVESHVLPLLGSGELRVPIAASYPMDKAEEAYARFAEGAKFGKIVLRGVEVGS